MATTQEPTHDGAPHPAERKAVAAPAGATPTVSVSKTNETAAAGLAARARAEIETRTLMAWRLPRDLVRFRQRMVDACNRIAFADSAMWERPVGSGKTTSGLSIRFAEECARNYTNLDISIVVVSEDDEHRVIEAVGVDLEVNVIHRVQAVIPKYVERLAPRAGDEIMSQRTNSRGITTYRIRANDDAMFTEHQRAAAKAKREVILFFIPSEIKEECEELIERTIAQVGGDPEKFRAKLIKTFDRIAVEEKQLEKYLGKVLSQASIPELKMLQRAYNAINQGETTWDDLMAAKRGPTNETTAEKPAGNGTTGLRDVVAKRAAAAKPADATDDLAEDRRLVDEERQS